MTERNHSLCTAPRFVEHHLHQKDSTLIGIGIALAVALFADALWAGVPVELTMHWPMEPWTSETLVLETEVGSSGALENFPDDGSEWVVGVLGRALVFDGNDQHATHDKPLPRAQGTIGHWLQPSAASGTRIALYESDFSGAAAPDYNGFGSAGDALEIHTGLFDGDWYAVWQDGDISTKREVRGGTVAVDEWTHVAVTWRIPGEMRLYVNCELVNSALMDAAFENRTPTEHFVGKPSQFIGRHWDGAIDEIKVWNREFDAIGVRSHFCPEIQPESDVLFAETPALGDQFGSSAALSGDWLLVRSSGASEVTWYRRNNHADFLIDSARPSVFTNTISPSPETPKPLDVSGTIAAIANAGAVDVYELSAPTDWNLATTLPGASYENFGFAVAVSGERIAVGAPSSSGGSAFVVERDQGGPGVWGETFADTPGSFDSDEFTGRFVDIDGDLLAVFRQSVSLLSTTDVVDLYRRGEVGGVAGWAPEASIGYDGDSIASLALRGNRLAIGIAPSSVDTEGGVIVHERNQGGIDQWGIEHTFRASDRDRLDKLGANLVWLDDKTLAAAATATDEDHQAVYVFEIGGASQQSQREILVPRTFDPITEVQPGLGTSLTGARGLVIAGAPRTGVAAERMSVNPPLSGRLHVFVSPVIFADSFESEGL